jgi:ElaB/YqjD/DUF883 family membrane-anchored ribosome-binding protein
MGKKRKSILAKVFGNGKSGLDTHNGLGAAAEGAIDRFTGVAEHTARNSMGKMSAVAGEAVDWASHKADDMREVGQKLTDETNAYVVAQPWKSVAVALVVGIFIGKLIL